MRGENSWCYYKVGNLENSLDSSSVYTSMCVSLCVCVCVCVWCVCVCDVWGWVCGVWEWMCVCVCVCVSWWCVCVCVSWWCVCGGGQTERAYVRPLQVQETRDETFGKGPNFGSIFNFLCPMWAHAHTTDKYTHTRKSCTHTHIHTHTHTHVETWVLGHTLAHLNPQRRSIL